MARSKSEEEKGGSLDQKSQSCSEAEASGLVNHQLTNLVNGFYLEIAHENVTKAKLELGTAESMILGLQAEFQFPSSDSKGEDDLLNEQDFEFDKFNLKTEGLESPSGESFVSVPMSSPWCASAECPLVKVSAKIFCCGGVGRKEDGDFLKRCLLTKSECPHESHKQSRPKDGGFEDGLYVAVNKASFLGSHSIGYGRMPSKMYVTLTEGVDEEGKLLLIKPILWRLLIEELPSYKLLNSYCLSPLNTEIETSSVPTDCVSETSSPEPASGDKNYKSLRFLLVQLQGDFSKINTTVIQLKDSNRKLREEVDDLQLGNQSRDENLKRQVAYLLQKLRQEFLNHWKKSGGGIATTLSDPSVTRAINKAKTELNDTLSKAIGDVEGKQKIFDTLLNDNSLRMDRMDRKLSTTSICFGDFEFRDEMDVRAVLEKHVVDQFPSKNKPEVVDIGPAMCIMTMFYHMKSVTTSNTSASKTRADETKAGYNNPIQAKTMNSVTSTLSPVFYGSDMMGDPNEALKKVVKSDAGWFKPGNASYCFSNALKNQAKQITTSTKTHLNNKFVGSPEFKHLCREMIDFSYSWICNFVDYISEYNKELTAYGFVDEDKRWKEIRDVFTAVMTTLANSRSESHDSTDPSVILWGNLNCIDSAQEFLKLNFGSHPVLVACLLRTMVTSQIDTNSDGNVTVKSVNAKLTKTANEVSTLKTNLGNLKKDVSDLKAKN